MTNPDITTQSLVDSIQSIYEASQIQNQSLVDKQEINKPYDRETHQAQIRLQELIIGYSLSNAEDIYDEDYDDILNRNDSDRFIDGLTEDNNEAPNENPTQDAHAETSDESPSDSSYVEPHEAPLEESQTEPQISEYERGYRDGYKDGYTDGQGAVMNELPPEEVPQEEVPVEESIVNENITLDNIDADENLPEESLVVPNEYPEEQLVIEEEEEVDLTKSKTSITLRKEDCNDEDEVYRI